MNETLYLDLTRLLQAAWRRTPSGIERVEFAYAETFGGAPNTIFVAGQFGRIEILPKPRTQLFLASLEKKWGAGGQSPHREAIFHAVLLYAGLLLKTALSLAARTGETPAPGAVYANLSHENLRSPRALARFKSRTGAKIICFVHDLIPITHPEYARAGQNSRHRQRIETVGAMADAVIVNSADTKHEFLRFLQPRSRPPAVHVIHLGVKAAPSPPETSEITPNPSPYFLIVATIEPRKNHLLLLHLWREFGQAGGPVPRLILVGRRGWENEMVIDMLERCAALDGLVEERSAVSDRDLATLMRHARAVLLPAFAEGFGLPICEALAAGTPVICSDLAAMRETGLDVPDYLDPLDGAGWRQAILDYAQTPSPRREAQCARLEDWSPPSWERHFQQARAIIQDLASPRPQG